MTELKLAPTQAPVIGCYLQLAKRALTVRASSTLARIRDVSIGNATLKATTTAWRRASLPRDGHDAGWSHHLGRLNIIAEGGEPGPDALADPTVRHG